jgi:replication-associated recombination protein RarA
VSLFESSPLNHLESLATDSKRPLADRMRPAALDDWVGDTESRNGKFLFFVPPF